MSSRLLPTPNDSLNDDSLNDDVLLIVFEALPESSLRTVSQVSKAFHDLALSVLYHIVDFSAKPVIDIHGCRSTLLETAPPMALRTADRTQTLLRHPSPLICLDNGF